MMMHDWLLDIGMDSNTPVITLHIIDNNPEPRTSSIDCDIQKTYEKGKLQIVNNNIDLFLEINYEESSYVLE